jgi:hypothetical protein
MHDDPKFNEMFISTFAKPQPVPRSYKVLKDWMGQGQCVIDVECGSGFYTELCQARGNSVVGIDITSRVHAVHSLCIPCALGM